jgi:hypothetical protein
MSLVSEALRKARQEAAAGESRPRLAGIPPVLVRSGGAGKLGTGLVLGALIALAAAVVGAGGAWLAFGRHQEPAISGGGATAAPASTPAPSAADGIPADRSAVPPGPGAEQSVAQSPSAAEAPPVPPPAAPTAGAPGAAQAGEGAAPAGSEAREGGRTAQQTTAGGEDTGHHERIYVLDADLGYAKLHLDYIVYKPGAPFGRINGENIVEGSYVAGFRVEKIEPELVRLVDRHGPLILRAH